MVVDRESWLKRVVEIVEQDILNEHQASMPEKWEISCGFAGNAKAIGVAFSNTACKDGETYQIFISPILGNNDKVNLMQTILHEMLHCVATIEVGHKGEFKRLARAIGLEGRLTHTYVSDTNPLAELLLKCYNKVGVEYPHKEIIPEVKEKKERVKNFVNLVSEDNPEYVVKMKKSVFEAVGVPVDPYGKPMVLVEGDE